MVKTINFSENFEEDLSRVGEKVKKQLESADAQNIPEKEIVKKSIQEFAQETPAILPASSSDDVSSDEDLDDEYGRFLPEYFKSKNIDGAARRIVDGLVKNALEKGIERAIRRSKKFPPFIEDAFHDALVEKAIPELKKKGILK